MPRLREKAVKPPPNPLEQESKDRLYQARSQKIQFELDYRECYFFAAPIRQRNISSQSPPTMTRQRDEAELQTSIAFELVQDFITVVLNAFMPEAEPWCERRPGMFVPEDAWKEVADRVRAGDEKIFAAMKASNLYPELAKAMFPDIAIGTCGMWIHDPRPAENVVCSSVPIRELEINLGPYGEVDDRFAVRYTKYRYVKALVPEVKDWPEEIAKAIEDRPNERCEVRWGFWRIWDRIDDEVWQAVILVNECLVHSSVLKGEGSCPLLVFRFNPTADWAWGIGPLVQALPDLRQVDELQGQKISHVELSLTPPLTYPDDSFAQVEQGFEAGAAYPIRPGSEGAVKRIYEPGSPEAAIYQFAEFERRLRKLFFSDFPEQRGQTPPTATQWLDEMQMSQRRIGTPGMPFWREGPAKIFLRFKYLLEKARVIEPVTVNGKHVALQPYNPAQRAAEQQQVAMAVRTIEICGQAFPEEFKVQIDGKQTMNNIVEKMRTGDLIAFRKEQDIKSAVDNIAKLVGGRHAPGGDPAVANIPGLA